MITQGALSCLQIIHPRAQALVALQGAQVLQYVPTGRQPVIWLSEQAEYHRGQPVRGGVPVCWPWFADFHRNPVALQSQYSLRDTPAHGWARTSEWQLQQVEDSEERVVLWLGLPVSATHVLPVMLRLRIEVGAELKLSLVNDYTDTGIATLQPFALSQALHTYLAVSHIDNVTVEGLVGVPHLDTLRDWQRCVEEKPVRIVDETDRIYQGEVSHVVLHDTQWARRIHLRSSGSGSLILWNPHIAKSLRLSQFAQDAWQRMLCIETANVMDDIVWLRPGEKHEIQVEIALST